MLELTTVHGPPGATAYLPAEAEVLVTRLPVPILSNGGKVLLKSS